MKKSFLKSARDFAEMCLNGLMPAGSRTFAMEIENGAKVVLHFYGRSNALLFTMYDTKDPSDKRPHGYPKILWGKNRMDEFMAEIERECDYISEIHAPKRKSDKRYAIKVA